MGNANDVRQYDKVLYTANDGETYDAVALSAPALSFHAGAKQANHYLNLIYLDRHGNPVRITAAPLRTAAATPEELSQHARLTVESTFPRPRTDAEVERKAQAFATERQRLDREPRNVGWSPLYALSNLPKPIFQSLTNDQVRDKLEEMARRLHRVDVPEGATVGQFIEVLNRLLFEPDYGRPIERSYPVEGTIGEPSAEDLDAVAAEEAVKAATAAPEGYGQHDVVNDRNRNIPCLHPVYEEKDGQNVCASCGAPLAAVMANREQPITENPTQAAASAADTSTIADPATGLDTYVPAPEEWPTISPTPQTEQSAESSQSAPEPTVDEEMLAHHGDFLHKVEEEVKEMGDDLGNAIGEAAFDRE